MVVNALGQEKQAGFSNFSYLHDKLSVAFSRLKIKPGAIQQPGQAKSIEAKSPTTALNLCN
jgi:hypothetical protein